MKTKKPKPKFERTTISVPSEIRHRMKNLKRNGVSVNWSQIATEAFLSALTKLESGNHQNKSLAEMVTILERKVVELERRPK